MNTRDTTVLVTMIVGLSLCLVESNYAMKDLTKTIAATELMSGECEILGMLKQRYGTVVKIRGVWNRNKVEEKTGKGAKFVFSVHALRVCLSGKSCGTK